MGDIMTKPTMGYIDADRSPEALAQLAKWRMDANGRITHAEGCIVRGAWLVPTTKAVPGDQWQDDSLDMTCIAPRLWQGSVLRGDTLKARGIDVVVLCAADFQPGDEYFPGVEVVRAPMVDDYLTAATWQTARAAARQVVGAWREGKRVLVACLAGRNRSGLVMALALADLWHVGMADIVHHIRRYRKDALRNETFVAALRSRPHSERDLRVPFGMNEAGAMPGHAPALFDWTKP